MLQYSRPVSYRPFLRECAQYRCSEQSKDMGDFTLTFSAELWMYHGKGAWYFLTLPKEDSEQITFLSSQNQRGWGSVRVTASIGQTTWQTSVFPDKKAGAYLLPVKAEVRKKEHIGVGNIVTVTLAF